LNFQHPHLPHAPPPKERGELRLKARARHAWRRIRSSRTYKYLRQLNIRAHHVRRATVIAAIGIALLVVFVVGAAIRLVLGPIPLGAFSDKLHHAMNNALPGVGVRYDDAALEWSSEEGRINLVILGARVFDAEQHIIAEAPKAEIGLGLMALFNGRVEVHRITLVGVQLTMSRDKAGMLHLGVARDKSQGDILQRIRDAIEKSGKGPSSLDRFAVSKARLAFYDESSGLFLVAPQAKLEVANDTTGQYPVVAASFDADVEITGQPAHVVGTVRLPKSGGAISGDISITGLQLQALADNAKSFAMLAPFDLKTDLSGSFAFDSRGKLRSADLGLGATGSIGGMGSPLKVKSFRFVGRYDGLTGRVLVDDASLEGETAKARFRGLSNLTFTPDGNWSGASLDLQGEQISVGMSNAFQHSFDVGHIALRGNYAAADRTFTLDRFGIDGPGVTGALSGRVVLADNASPEIDLSGSIGQMSVRDLVRYWPLRVGAGAREWIAANMPAGKVGPLAIMANIKPGQLDGPALPNEALKLTFPIANASVNYIHGLTLLTNANGTGTLTGDTFQTDVTSGHVGPLVVEKARVVIPNLHQHGTPAGISLTANGQMRDVLSLIDLKPLQYPTRFHIRPADTAGAAKIDATFQVPTLKNVDVSKIGVSVHAAVNGFAMPIGTRTKLTNGTVTFDVDNQRLHAAGNVTMDRTPVFAEWTETFNTQDDITSRMVIRGTLDDAAREALHIGLDEYLTGPVGIVANIDGHRGTMRRAHITADLTPATLALDLVNYRKAPGGAATAQISPRFDPKGDIAASDVTVTGAGLSASGSLAFNNGDLAHAEFASVRAGPANDFSLSLTRTAMGGTEANIRGASADGTGFTRRSAATNAANPKAAEDKTTLHLTAKLDRIVLRDGVTMSPFALDLTQVGDRVQSLTIAAGGKPDALSASIAPVADGRKLTIEAANAGAILKGVLGLSDIAGGEMNVDAKLAPLSGGGGKVPDYAGTLVIRDFKIENQPFFARLFSAGSLGGLLDLMRGQGIVIDKLTMPFSAKNDVVDIREAHASGPSIGISGEGYLDRRSNKMDLRGAVAPVYGINGVLNSIPVLGDLLTGKKGEGILGVTYEASGSIDEPRITVNPLAMLTPGIFRRIFEGKVPSAPQQAEQPAPATPLPKPAPQH